MQSAAATYSTWKWKMRSKRVIRMSKTPASCANPASRGRSVTKGNLYWTPWIQPRTPEKNGGSGCDLHFWIILRQAAYLDSTASDLFDAVKCSKTQCYSKFRWPQHRWNHHCWWMLMFVCGKLPHSFCEYGVSMAISHSSWCVPHTRKSSEIHRNPEKSFRLPSPSSMTGGFHKWGYPIAGWFR